MAYKGKEVAALIVGATVHVLGQLHAVLRDVGGGVADGGLAVAAVADVLAHVASGGLDVGGGEGGVGQVVDDLVAGEEGEQVGVLDEGVDGGEDALQVLAVVRLVRVGAVDRVERVVGVDDDVDARVRQRVHARVVVLGVVRDVHAHRVDAQLRELGQVPLAHVRVRQRVRHGRGAAGLVVDAADVEALAARPESCHEPSTLAVSPFYSDAAHVHRKSTISGDRDGGHRVCTPRQLGLGGSAIQRSSSDDGGSRQSRHNGEGLHGRSGDARYSNKKPGYPIRASSIASFPSEREPRLVRERGTPLTRRESVSKYNKIGDYKSCSKPKSGFFFLFPKKKPTITSELAGVVKSPGQEEEADGLIHERERLGEREEKEKEKRGRRREDGRGRRKQGPHERKESLGVLKERKAGRAESITCRRAACQEATRKSGAAKEGSNREAGFVGHGMHRSMPSYKVAGLAALTCLALVGRRGLWWDGSREG